MFNPQMLMQMLMQKNPGMMQQFQQFQQMMGQNPQMQQQFRQFQQQVNTNPTYKEQVFQQAAAKMDLSPEQVAATQTPTAGPAAMPQANSADPRNIG